MGVKERFLKYVKTDTQSDPTTGTSPSTRKQFDLANILAQELKALGLKNVRLDEHCYVYAEIEANTEGVPSIGFIAHLDTEPVCSGKNVKPQCVLYEGGDIPLGNGKVTSVREFPFLKHYVGKELIVTGGDTLLGADDKAGVAEIVTAAEYILSHPEIKHGKIGIAFTPDEEIGEGATYFDVKGFGCDFAYTVDGGAAGELGFETFNAAEAVLTFTGKNIHPGSAKGKMVNCSLIAADFLAALPQDEIPEKTEGREGFYHVTSVNTEIETGSVALIIRDHDADTFKARKAVVERIARELEEKYGKGSVALTLRDQYYNCYEVIKDHTHLIDNAKAAMEALGLTVTEDPVRGGTDGSRLSFMGLPCPNLFTGGRNPHSVHELIPVFEMEKAVETIVRIIEIYGKA